MKTLLLAGGFASLFCVTAVQADTITYTYDNQAFWGQHTPPLDAATWQAGREAAVAAAPGDFDYFDGLIGFGSLHEIADFSFTIDFGPVSHTFSVPGLYSHFSDFTQRQYGVDVTEGFGPMVTFGPDTDTQYEARLVLGLTRYPGPETMTMNISASLREFTEHAEASYCYNPYADVAADLCSTGAVFGAYDTLSTFQSTVYASATDSAEPVGASAVPLPASGLMLLGALGVAGTLRRKRHQA